MLFPAAVRGGWGLWNFCWSQWLTEQFGDVWLFIISGGVSGLELKSFILDWFSRSLFFFFYHLTFTLCQSVNTPCLNHGVFAYPCLYSQSCWLVTCHRHRQPIIFSFFHIFSWGREHSKTPPSLHHHHYPSQWLPSAPFPSSSPQLHVLCCSQERLQYPTGPTVNHHYHDAKHHCPHSCLVWHLCPAVLSSFWQRAISSFSQLVF